LFANTVTVSKTFALAQWLGAVLFNFNSSLCIITLLLRHTNGESSLVRCERRRVLKLQMASVGAPTLSASDHAYDHACYVFGLVRVNWRS
jgi:hypothetical protein